MSQYLIQQLDTSRTSRALLHRGGVRPRTDHLEPLTLREAERRDGAARRPPGCSRSSAPHRHRLAGRRPGPGNRGFVVTGPDLLAEGRPRRLAARPAAVPPGDQRARRVRSRATSAPTPSSASPRRWARAPWPSPSFTVTWSCCDRGAGKVTELQTRAARQLFSSRASPTNSWTGSSNTAAFETHGPPEPTSTTRVLPAWEFFDACLKAKIQLVKHLDGFLTWSMSTLSNQPGRLWRGHPGLFCPRLGGRSPTPFWTSWDRDRHVVAFQVAPCASTPLTCSRRGSPWRSISWTGCSSG